MLFGRRPGGAEGAGEVEEFGFASDDVQAEFLFLGAEEEAGGQRDANE